MNLEKNGLNVVLHVSNLDQIQRMLNNVSNLLKEDSAIKISVVINGEAVKGFTRDKELFLNPQATYYLCNNSLRSNQISLDNLLDLTHVTPSGVYKLTLLQQQGFFYIKV